MVAAIEGLRGYLARIGFGQIYKFLAGVNHYAVMPSLVSRQTVAAVAGFFDTVLSDRRDLGIAQCLLYGRPVRREELGEEAALADALIAAGLLRDSAGMVVAADRQLISAFGIDLLIDRRIHFGNDLHQVYIGPDSYWMLYYIDAGGVPRGGRALDLCTGTGIAALYAATLCDEVVATDIDPVALELVTINRRLNGRDGRLEVRDERLETTLARGERFDLLTCNPPFVAFPPGLDGTVFAQGPDVDGLGYMRAIVEALPEVMTSGGSAYLVADLVGDASGPHFARELGGMAARGRLDIDVYVDNVVPASVQVEAFTPFLHRLNPTRSRTAIADAMTRFVGDTLKSDRYFMSTVRLRTDAARPGVRAMRRAQPIPAATAWPAILR